MKPIKKTTVSVCAAIFMLQWQIWSHVPGGGSGGGAFGGSGAGRSFSGVSIYSTNDSAKIAFDLYSNFLYSLCTDFNQGQQLGPGGKLSAMYNAFLYRVSTSQTPYPYKGNYDLQQNDFGYTPIWQGNVISSRVRYRFLPNLWGTITTDCNMDGIAANAKDAAQYIQIGALDIKWAPKLLNNFALTIGKINLSGTYCSIFDQMPLENFLFNGLSMDYAKKIKDNVFLSGTIALGQQFLGRTMSFTDTTGRYMFLYGDLGKPRNRNHLFLRAQVGYKRICGAKFIGGVQMTPADSTQVSYSGQTKTLVDTLYLPRSTGWHIGMELVLNTKRTNHYGIVAYGKGDVQLAWLSPDYINKPDNGGVTDWFNKNEFLPDFSAEGSAITYGMYWNNFLYKNLIVGLGICGVWGNPAKDVATYSFNNSHWVTDSQGNVTWITQIDSVTLKAQDYKTLKGAIKASLRIVKPLRIGVRYDEIHFFDPDAHANIPELLWMKPEIDPLADPTGSTFFYLRDKLAKWEREAVNARILTPFITMEIVKTFRIRAAYACAFYERPVYRQSRLSDFHGNFTLGATLTYRFAKLPD